MFIWAGCKTRVHHLAGKTPVACLNHKIHIQKIYISLIDAEEYFAYNKHINKQQRCCSGWSKDPGPSTGREVPCHFFWRYCL